MSADQTAPEDDDQLWVRTVNRYDDRGVWHRAVSKADWSAACGATLRGSIEQAIRWPQSMFKNDRRRIHHGCGEGRLTADEIDLLIACL